MRNTITIRRWRIDLYESAIYIQKQPDPKCSDCEGTGSHYGSFASNREADEPDIIPCRCWDPFRNLRIPLGRRPVVTERWPF